jgi:hypothetical protein
VTALLLGAALGAAAALSWLHLRPRGARSAQAIPSLQHLTGPSLRQRRSARLEEPLAWALRVATLALALLGVWVARSHPTPGRPLVVVDPEASAEAWEQARALSDTGGLLGFRGEQPVALGEVAPQVEEALGACSDTRAACLLRAAERSGQPLLLVGAFASTEWRLALTRRRTDFAFLRTTAGEPPAAGPVAPPPPLARIHLEGDAAAARVWAAALSWVASRGEPREDGRGADAPAPLVAVVPASGSTDGQPEAALRVVAVEQPSPAGAQHPAAEARSGTGLVLPDPLDLAAGTPGLGLPTSLRFLPDAHFTQLLPVAARRREAEATTLAVAATPEDVGSWAHQGSLLPLARAVLAAALPGPALAETLPVGGPLGWTEGEGHLAPVGLLDVHPGRYLRSDAKAVLHLARTRVAGVERLDDAALEGLGGHRWAGPPAALPPTATLLLAAALLLWLTAVWHTRHARRAWLPAAAVAGGLGLLTANVGWHSEDTAPWVALLALPRGLSPEELISKAHQAGVTVRLREGPSTPGCASPGAEKPCALLATVGLAAAPAPGVDALLFDAQRPRVDVLSVQTPAEVPLGSAAELWATVRVRRAEGRRVSVTARSTSAAPVSTELPVEGPDVVRLVRLDVSPLSEGVGFVAVEASLPGEPQAQDGRLVALAARRRTLRRMVLAAAPGWEARAAADALEAPGASVQVLTRLGASAVVARGHPAEDPRHLLGRPEALGGVDLVALVGFPAGALDGRAAAGLRRFVQGGGAALVLEAPGAAAALGFDAGRAAATAPLGELSGQWGSEAAFGFRGYLPPPALPLPAGAAVLGRLGTQGNASTLPWVVGRALGQGRVALVTAPDLWRLSSPGQGRAAYRNLLARLVGWLEAPRSARGVVLAEDWASLRWEDGSATRTIALPTTAPVDALPVEPVDLATVFRWPRARLRAEAAAAHHPFLEEEGAEALAAAWGRLPPPPRWRTRVPVRASDAAWCTLAALLVLEAMARRLYGGGGGGGSRASTAPSSEEAGGTTSGEGRSQRASAVPAPRAAALRAEASFAA